MKKAKHTFVDLFAMMMILIVALFGGYRSVSSGLSLHLRTVCAHGVSKNAGSVGSLDISQSYTDTDTHNSHASHSLNADFYFESNEKSSVYF